jgi:hypothetical protein
MLQTILILSNKNSQNTQFEKSINGDKSLFIDKENQRQNYETKH